MNRLEFLLHDVELEADCFTKKHYEVHIKAVVSLRVDAVPLGTRGKPAAWRTPEEMYPLVRDVFIRALASAMAEFAWDEMLRKPRQVTDRAVAAAEPEMTELGLTTRSFLMKTVDFPEGSKPRLALRRAMDMVDAERRAKARPRDEGGERG